jgi:3-methyl-2-oxobutanoate hydroxymethyltransferase
MPYLKPERPEKVSAPSLRSSKQRGERLVCLTAYDYPTARIVDEAGIDVILLVTASAMWCWAMATRCP